MVAILPFYQTYVKHLRDYGCCLLFLLVLNIKACSSGDAQRIVL
jgi:hypothetical protein